ncbi:hypothetical protein DL766_005224 [Monosporascus sp. MC13-8B]|uniref:Copper-fist domain-containing protein n=1 Tax=Monosporascus cannonballus TaxID=155416 RepID=A0ABY0HGM5_9PEZI|nr:hypothetical protein DL762_001361 [Monosporascus cannonballus]RYP00408.1 hypothetical protein DL763_000874 [Monosporascus cannonballus]RYP29767.1 hypothetical protein DL766_005224 [Monosporascus sp. MC13-8B]
MSLAEKDPDFRSLVDAAAANWYSQRSISPGASQPRSSFGDPRRQSPHVHADGGGVGVGGGQPSNGASTIGSDITAWQTALQSLPEEFRSSPLPVHPLAQSLAVQPTLRQVEWNQYRQYGGFVPRTPHDFSSLMIYASGQVNPNPCRRCILKNGPFARCIVSPPSVLAQSTLRHACANCTYQNQYKKCTNEPVTEEELVRSRAQRAAARPPPTLLNDNNKNSNTPPTVRRPRVNSAVRKYHKDGRPKKKLAAAAADGHGLGYGYVVHGQQDRPTAQSISADSFADKLLRARAWSPRSRRRVRAEAMQWQAAIATVEAEKTRTTGVSTDTAATPAPPPRSTQITDNAAVAPQASVNANVAGLTFPAPASAAAATSSLMFAPPPSSFAPPPSSAFAPPASTMDESMHDMEDEGGQFDEEDDEELDDESEGEGEGEENDFDGEGPSWVGFDDTGPPLKPPL